MGYRRPASPAANNPTLMNSFRLPARLLAGTLALAATIARCEEKSALSLEQRLARLEAQLARIETRLNDTVSADELAPTLKEFSELTRQLGWDGKAALTVVKAGGREQKLSLGGYVQAQGEFGRAPDSRYTGINNRILLRRARLTVKGSFQENFDFTLQSDFGNNSIGGVTGYRAQLADAFLNWNKYEAANLQIGQFKTPFGYEQLLSDTKTLTIERSLPNDLLTVGRQIGIGLSGTVAAKRVSYSVGAFNGNGTNNGFNDNQQFMYAGRVAVTAWTKGADKLSLGANGFWSSDTGAFTGRRTGAGLDGQLTLGRFDLNAEYLHLISNRITGADTTAEGWSALAGYFLLPKKFQAVVSFASYEANVRAANTTSEEWIIGANYYVKGDDLKLVFNYTLGDPAGPLSHEGRFAARLQVVF